MHTVLEGIANRSNYLKKERKNIVHQIMRQNKKKNQKKKIHLMVMMMMLLIMIAQVNV